MPADNFMWFTAAAKGGQLSEAATKPQGETTDNWFAKLGAFEVKNVTFDIEQAESAGSATGGAGVGKAKFGTFKITRDVDLASAPMFQACCAGAHFPAVMLACRKASGEKLIYLQYCFRMVYVTNMNWSGGGGDEAPVENIEFVYGGMGVQYCRQLPTGAPDTPIVAMWSALQNKATLDLPNLGATPAFLSPGQA
jgi:type VI protein secretion system component Hcp